jgi:sec-independent protein translocase protein TatA
MPSWIGPWEIVIVVVIILLVFGGRLLPRLGRSLGGSITGLRQGLKDGTDEFRQAVKEDEVEKPAKAAKSSKTPVVEAKVERPDDEEQF